MKLIKLGILVIFMVLLQQVVLACGGRDIILSDTPEQYNARYNKAYQDYLYYDEGGNLVMKKENIKISKKVADQIVEEYLDKNHPDWEDFVFEVLDIEHGRPVYMYGAHVDDVAITYHVGGANFITDHVHLHVDAITGQLFDVGCGGGPSKVLNQEVPPFTSDMEWDKVLPNGSSYFYTKFQIPEGTSPNIDGNIEKEEWSDAVKEIIHLGTAETTMKSYGCGGSGKTVSVNPEYMEVTLYSKIVGNNIYFAIKSDSENWMGLMLKDFPHHGMIGDFGDVKIMQNNKVTDYYLSRNPKSDVPENKELGSHGCNGYGKLIKDSSNNLLEQASEKYEYEFSFPLNNEDLADSHWKKGNAYQIALLVGGSKYFTGINKDTWMSTQETVRLGEQLDFDYIIHNEKVHDHSTHSHDEPNIIQRVYYRLLTLIYGG